MCTARENEHFNMINGSLMTKHKLMRARKKRTIVERNILYELTMNDYNIVDRMIVCTTFKIDGITVSVTQFREKEIFIEKKN